MNKETTEMNALQVQLPPDISVEEARLLLMVKLFKTGRVTLGQAAKLAGYSKPTFIELLGKMGVPVIDYPAEDLQQEINL
jgi:predicted HTH domain antitoxin